MNIPTANSERQRLEQLEQVFFAALARPENQRASYLEETCGSDAQLRSAIETMLRADQDHTGLIDTGPWQAAQAAAHLDCSDPLAAPGTRIGQYQLVQRIGVGGMGTVWRARRMDDAFDRDVAIKLIKRGMDSDEIVRRFRRERQLLARLEHPNIARLYDGGATDDGRPYLVMEYIDGVPIQQYCRENELTVDQKLDLARTVCGAVHFAHTNLVLHRDIKPANVLVTHDGCIKLLDFGIARLIDDEGAAVTATSDRPALTPKYASPEQFRGEPLSTASDVYSLGVLLYEILTGQSPYEPHTKTGREVERAALHQTPATASAAVARSSGLAPARRRDLVRALRGDLDAIVDKALQKLPADRYASAEQLGEDLRRRQEGLPLLARRIGAIRRSLRALRRNRKGLVAASVVAIAAVTLTTLGVTYAFMSPRWAQDHVRQAHRAFVTSKFSNTLWIISFNNARKAPSRDGRPACSLADSSSALESYDAALRLDPTLDEVRLERDTIWLAAEISRHPDRTPSPPKALLRVAPLTCAYATAWTQDGLKPILTDEQLNQASETDLRCLGLLTLACRNVVDCLQAWSRLGDFDSDPLVEALLGVLYLAIDQPERAYPKLLSAYREFPELGFLCAYLADAALRCGDTAFAGRLIEHAETLDHLDPMMAHKRIRIMFLLQNGDLERADELFNQPGGSTNLVTRLHYAQHLFGLGQRRRALSILGEECGYEDAYVRTPDSMMRTLFELTQRWWSELSESSQVSVIESAMHESIVDIDSLFRILRAYEMTNERAHVVRAQHPLSLGVDGITGDPLLQTIAHAELMELYSRLEIANEDRWFQFADYPPELRARQLDAWLHDDDPASSSRRVDQAYVDWRREQEMSRTIP